MDHEPDGGGVRPENGIDHMLQADFKRLSESNCSQGQECGKEEVIFFHFTEFG